MNRRRKDSNVAWLGDLPDTWSAVPLKQRTALVSRGRSPDYSEDEQGVPIVNQACIYWDGIRYDNVKWQRRETLSGERGRIRQGDLLMNSTGTGTLGRVALFDRSGEYLADSHVTVIRATNDTVPSFLRYVLQTGIYQGYVYAVLAPGATNQIELSREGLRRTPFPMPPVEEQRAIASLLDRKTAAIDALIAKKEHLIEMLDEKRQSLISQTVTKGLDPNVPMKDSGVDWLDRIPAHWKHLRLKQLSHRISGRLVYQPAQYFTDDGVPFIMGNNVTERGISLEQTKFIPPDVNARFAHHALRAGDIVMVRVGAPGVTAVVGVEADGLNCGSLMIVRRNPAFHSPWLAAVMNSPIVRAQIDLVQYGAAQEQINITDAVNFWIPTPPLDEQERIAMFLARATGHLDKITDTLRKQLDRLREYRQALITAAVTGKIDISKEAA